MCMPSSHETVTAEAPLGWTTRLCMSSQYKSAAANFFKVTHPPPPAMQRPWPRPRPGTLVALASLLSIVYATAVEDGCSGNSRCQHLEAFLQWYRDREGGNKLAGLFFYSPTYARSSPHLHLWCYLGTRQAAPPSD